MIEQYLAIDLGASGGRVILSEVEDNHTIRLTPIHSFPNEMVNILGHLHWDMLGIYREILQGLRICAAQHTTTPVSMAVDTWGTDFGFLDAQGNMVSNPFAYRDKRTQRIMEIFHKKIDGWKLYQLTGLEARPMYSLMQYYSMVRDKSPLLEIAKDLLFIPDIFNYFLCGVKKTEFTHAAGSQFFSPLKNDWDSDILKAASAPEGMMQEILPDGTLLGKLDEAIAAQTGLEQVPVVLTATHDTSDAVAAVPALEEDFAYVSSGTWSLVGIESQKPIINRKTYEYKIANQGGAWGTYMVLKNITGLWLLQEARREWAKTKGVSFSELVQMAAEATPTGAVIDPDHDDFFKPQSMPIAIEEYLHRSGQPAPKSKGECVRVILESLALAYRYTLDQLEEVRGRKLGRLYIVGGGSQNKLLCQFAADATGKAVSAGPVEATAAGNVLLQSKAFGKVTTPRQLREIVRRSFPLETYQPKQSGYWERGYEKFKELKRI